MVPFVLVIICYFKATLHQIPKPKRVNRIQNIGSTHTHTSAQRLLFSTSLFPTFIPSTPAPPTSTPCESYCWQAASFSVCFMLLYAFSCFISTKGQQQPKPPRPAASLLSFYGQQLLGWLGLKGQDNSNTDFVGSLSFRRIKFEQCIQTPVFGLGFQRNRFYTHTHEKVKGKYVEQLSLVEGKNTNRQNFILTNDNRILFMSEIS